MIVNATKQSVPILFTHYGFSRYLPHTLACASKTNRKTSRIFLGDGLNRAVAREYGWAHHEIREYQSTKLEKFQSVFRHIKGRDHPTMLNGQDWLRYVFARWFYMEEFLLQNGIERFWHFDSDTMLLTDLGDYPNRINYDFTTQCNGTCLNGLIRTQVVSEFNDHTIAMFENTETMMKWEGYMVKHPTYSFNEMTAFNEYQKTCRRAGVHLMRWSDTEVFDDAIRQEHGFEMRTYPAIESTAYRIKNIFKDKAGFFGIREGKRVKFLSLNLSWCNEEIFQWVLCSLNKKNANLGQIQRPRIRDALKKARTFIKKIIINLCKKQNRSEEFNRSLN